MSPGPLQGGYVSADSDHSSIPSLVDAGGSDEWTDDDQFVYDQWDGNDSGFRHSDLDDDYDGYSSDEWDASDDAEEAVALPLHQPVDNSTCENPLARKLCKETR